MLNSILRGVRVSQVAMAIPFASCQPPGIAASVGFSRQTDVLRRLQDKPVSHRQLPPTRRSAATTSTAAAAVSNKSLYSDPALYDRVFSVSRDYAKQVRFLMEACRQYNAGRDPQSFCELGCGPARHAILLAQQGLSGYAVDNSDIMLQHASAQAAEAGVSVQCINADMRETVAPEGESVDLVLMLCGTATHLHTNADARACFAAVSQALKPGGLFVIETSHPEDLFGGYMDVGDVWEVEEGKAGEKLTVHYGKEGDEFSPWTQVMDRTVEVLAHRNGKQVRVSIESVRQRYFTPTELDQLAFGAGLTTVATHGELTHPFMAADDSNSIAYVAVMQKQA